MPPEKGLSVIIPCFNEEENVAECVNRVPAMPWKTEVIVVDDGSIDDTSETARKLKKPGLKVISYKPNKGKGYAVRMGIAKASHDVVVIVDADMATMPEEIPNVVKPIMEGRADFVNASRLVYSMEAGAMKWFHVPVNHLFAFLVGLLVGARLTDSLCGFKAFRKSMLFEHLQEDGWPDFEMLIQAGRNGMRVVEVPTHYMARRKGASKMKSFRHGFAMLLMLLKAVFE